MANLNTAPGDGSLRVEVDVYGTFGSNFVGTDSGAFYDPLGETGEADTVFESFLVLRGNDIEGNISLTSSDLGDLEFINTSSSTAESNFTVAGLEFELNQTVSDILGEEQRIGSSLLQTYTITNPGDESIEFELIRYLDGDLTFDESIEDAGGRLFANGQEILFETDSGENPLFATTFVGITASGGSSELPGRFEVDSYSGLRDRILDGTPLDDTITGDGDDEDEFIDAVPYDVTLGLGNNFVLESGESTTYTTTTIFGSGSPEDIDTTVPDKVRNTIPTANDLSVLIGTRIEKDFIGGIDLNDFFRFELTDNSNFDLTLRGLSLDANLTLLDNQGNTIESFTAGENTDGSISQDLDAGTYYIRVFKLGADTTPYELEVSAIPIPQPFQIRNITPNQGSNAGQSTVTIFGNQFTPEADVSLIDEAGNQQPATSITWLDSETLSATFDLADSAVDSYDVQVVDTPGTAVIEDAFNVGTGNPGDLEVFVSSPSRVRPFGSSIVTVTYSNTGDTDITAPLLELTSDGATFRDFGATEFTEDSIQFLGINNQGLAGVLAAGASGSFTIEFEPTAEIGEQINFEVNTVNPDNTVEWEDFREELKPSFLSDAAWNPIYDNFVASVGDTAGDYQKVLVDNANYLSQIGENVADAKRLVSFELQQASGYQALSQRYSSSSFGRGRSFIGDTRLITDDEGNVIIENAETLRIFTLQEDGTYEPDTGDNGSLILENEVYRLTEQDGTVTVFRTDGQLDFIEDTNNNRITAEYTDGTLVSLVATNGDRFSLTRNSDSLITQTTDFAGRTTTYEYDEDLLTSVTTTEGTTSYTYNDQFAITSVTDPNGVQSSFEYDDRGRLTKESFNDGTEEITYSYGEDGQVSITDASGANTRLLLNDLGQVGQIQEASGRTLRINYDEAGNPIGIVAPNNGVLSFTYDSKGNVLSQVNPLGQRTAFTYQSDFNLLESVTDPRGNVIAYDYDESGNLISIAYEGNSSESFDYNEQGDITQSTNRRAQAINYQYNERGQLIRQDNADASFLEYAYDERGNLTSATDNNGTITQEYDDDDRLTKITYANGRSLTYTYDAGGRRTSMTDQDENQVNYSYDVAGRLASLTDGDDNSIVSYTYDEVGRIAREDNGNGTYTTYSYDLVGQITSIANFAADDSVNSRYDYSYDQLGQQTEVTTLDGSWSYSYDSIGQLTGAVFTSTNAEIPDQNLTYLYDAAGNRISTVVNGDTTEYSTNNLNQYETVGNAVYNYDGDGNLISKTEGENSETYEYNSENRLVRVIDTEGNETLYEYDPLGNRTATVYNGERTEYLIDPFGLGDVVGEYDNEGNLVANYTHGIGLVSRSENDDSAYYDNDAIGSIIGLTDGAGNQVNSYLYRPYGQELAETETIANPFEFVGQWGVTEERNGLDFMRARFYDPEDGRFNSTDPLGFASGDTNLYRYAFNVPNTLVDPSGEIIPLIVGGAITGALFNTALSALNSLRCGEVPTGRQLAGAALGGAIGGAIGGIAGPLGGTIAKGLGRVASGYTAKAATTIASGVGGAVGQEAADFIDPSSTAVAAGTSALGGAASTAISTKGVSTLKQARFFGPKRLGTLLSSRNGRRITGSLSTSAAVAGLGNFLSDCPPKDPPEIDPDVPTDRDLDNSSTDIVNSFDPNDIIGPAGFGERGWISSPQLFPYTIRFENEAERATAPAVLVSITHTLDSDLNLDSFELGDFGFGDLVVDVPDGFRNYSERLDLRETIGSFVDFEAGLDTETATVTWTLTTIDPETGELATGVDDGFLPPNGENGEGEGFVRYTIRPQDDLPTGTAINAVADIVFDTNEAIVTPEIVNTIDIDEPTSTVEALPITSGTSFDVSWTGDDAEGSGIASYDVFVSVDEGEFTLWQDDITETSATYEGEDGKTYSFYSVATDNIGQIQTIPIEAQASTTVEELDLIELYRFRNTSFDTGTYIFVGEAERDFILNDENLSNTFALDGVAQDGTVNPAFVASTKDADALIPFYRLESLAVAGTFLFVSTAEYEAIFAEDSNQKDQWKKQGFDEADDTVDIPEFYLIDSSANTGMQFNRFQNIQNGTFLYAGEAETEAIIDNRDLANVFTDQGGAFESFV